MQASNKENCKYSAIQQFETCIKELFFLKIPSNMRLWILDYLSNPEEYPKKNGQNNQSWSVEKLATFLSGLIPLADRYLNYKDVESKSDTEYLRTTSAHDRKVITILLLFLGALMGALVWLTATEKISGESLLFAVGLTIGYVFAIVQRFVFGSQRPVGDPNPE